MNRPDPGFAQARPEARLSTGRLVRSWRSRIKRLIPSQLVLYRIPTSRHSVFLTFDDGPHPEWTPQVLDMLRQEGAHATFFVVGAKAASHPHLIRRMVAEGHRLAGHTLNHAALSRADRQTLDQEIDGGNEAIASAGGGRVSHFRPPYGELDLRTIIAVKRRKLILTMWSHDIVNRTVGEPLKAMEAFEASRIDCGEIVLLHDDSSILRVLPGLLSSLSRRGWQCEALPDIIGTRTETVTSTTA